ncbi:MAG TPA: molybdopterin-binding protein [Stellaceae bacterium]|jgi:molybdenum cofactor synthesis domain-containing protein
MTDTPPQKPVTACVLIIGNEILSGRTQDTNLNFIAKGLVERGVRLMEARVIPDIADTIVATVNEVRAKYDYVFTTGGIGPTHDDITAECIAKAFGVPLVLNDEIHQMMLKRYPPGGLNEARLRMAHTPEGASLVPNPIQGPPGFRMGNVIVMAGVPRIMQGMFGAILHELNGGPPIVSRTVNCPLPEGVIARGLGEIQARYPELDIGSYPTFGRGTPETNLVLRGTDTAKLADAVGETTELVRSLGGKPTEL